jgi:putative ABC transport system permease protein
MNSLILAWHYICHYKGKTAIMISCVTLTVFLPLTLHQVLNQFQSQILHRAEQTPLVVGAKGSRFDLALHALYFKAQISDTLSMKDVQQIQASGYAKAIPLHVRFTAKNYPVVGTSLEYTQFRKLTVEQGRGLMQIGDCLVGAEVAKEFSLKPGDRLLTDPDNIFDIGGTYPLSMKVVGVLGKSYTADDDSVFVDVKTSWIIAGIGHGHQQLGTSEDEKVILERETSHVVANAALVHHTEITPKNIASFHFHAEPHDLPLTAIIAIPDSEKSKTLLQGRYVGTDTHAQVFDTSKVVEEMLGMILKVKRFFDANSILVACSTGLLLLLVLLLSLRLRQREMQTMFYLGCSRWTIFRLQGTELLITLTISFLAAVALSKGALFYAETWIRRLNF